MPEANTYTWTCPRCRTSVFSSIPQTPANCATCNYPDPPLDGQRPAPNPDAELEADVTPGEAMLQMSEEQLERLAVAGDQITLPETTKQMVGRVMQGIDRDWMAVCLKEGISALGLRIAPQRGTTIDGDPLVLLVNGAADMYERPRPTLLCGCAAGTHADSFAAMEEAHPERTHG